MTAHANTAADHAKGLALGLLGIFIISPDALVIRLVGMEPWSFVVWRGGFMTIGLALLLTLRYRLEMPAMLWRIGWLGILVGAVFAAVTVTFQFAVASTTAANVLVIMSTAPLTAAALARVVLGERTGWHTWLAIVICLVGMAMIFAGQIEAPSLFGEICALMASVWLGLYFVLVRLGRPTDMSPAVLVGALMMAVVALPLAGGLYLTPEKFALTTVHCLVLLPLSFMCLSAAPRYLPAPEVGLIVLLEAVLGPLWLWLVMTEVPAKETFAGGAVIIAALAIHALVSMRRARAASGPAPAVSG